MTKQEAIKQIKDHMHTHGIGKYPHNATYEALDMAVTALREQEERENPKLLTIEDLKQLEGRFVWWDWCGEYSLCKKEYVVTSNGTFSFNFVVNNGNAYRNKPKEE